MKRREECFDSMGYKVGIKSQGLNFDSESKKLRLVIPKEEILC